MNWQKFWDDVFNGAISGATLLFVFGTGSKLILDHWFVKRVENHKGEIAENLANVTASLNAQNKKQEVAFTWLHTNRAEVIIELYAKLAKAHRLIMVIIPSRQVDICEIAGY